MIPNQLSIARQCKGLDVPSKNIETVLEYATDETIDIWLKALQHSTSLPLLPIIHEVLLCELNPEPLFDNHLTSNDWLWIYVGINTGEIEFDQEKNTLKTSIDNIEVTTEMYELIHKVIHEKHSGLKPIRK